MAKTYFTLPAAVFLFIVKDGKVLLSQRHNTGWHDGDYDLVAGHIDGNESLTETVIREAYEEIGIRIRPENVGFAHLLHAYFAEDDTEYFDIYFTIRDWQEDPVIKEPEKCSDLQWFDLEALPENLTPSTAIGLKAYKENSAYSEFGFGQ